MLDLFFLEGMTSDRVIYDVTIAYLRVLETQILQCTNVAKVIDPQNPLFDNQTALLMDEVRRVRAQMTQSQIDQTKCAGYRRAYDAV